MANAANPLPIVVPCHRVVETGLRLGGYSGGLDRKRHLLALEGVKVHANRVLPGQLPLL
jgi:methylated-DNA-[protein]-cysteine S-methyltransferase